MFNNIIYLLKLIATSGKIDMDFICFISKGISIISLPIAEKIPRRNLSSFEYGLPHTCLWNKKLSDTFHIYAVESNLYFYTIF